MLSPKIGLVVYASLSSFGRAFTISIDTLFFLSKGFTFAGISSLEIALAATVMSLELVSGAVADRFGRKMALLISCTSRTLAYLFIISSGSYQSVLTAFIFFGIGTAFQSGALNAWLVDELETKKKSDKGQIQKRLASLSNIGNIGNAVGAVSGGFAFSIQPALPWKGSLLIFLVAAFVLLFTKEQRQGAISTRIRRSFVVQLAQSFMHIRIAACIYLGKPVLIWITAYACVSQIGMTGVIKVWQPWFANLLGSGGEALLGVIWMCFVVSNLLANRAVKDSLATRDSRRLVWASFLSGMPLLAFAFTDLLILALPLYMLHVFGEAYKDPILLGILHDEIDSANRATVESWFCFF
jgi:MFS family permease